MAKINAADIKALREQTGAGMLDVKNALDESGGDRDRAIEILRVKGLKGVTKREGRSASNGLVAAHVADGVGTLVEVNCETDFVAKGERFQQLAKQVLDRAVATGVSDPQALLASDVDGRTVRDILDDANAAIGEKIEIRRLARVVGTHVASYLHRTSPDLPPQIGVLIGVDTVGVDTQTQDVAKDVAMHAAAMSPTFLTREEVPSEVVDSERRIAEETAREEGKPEQAMARIVEGRVNGFFKDNVLLEQAFAKDSKKTVGQVLKESGTTVTGFARFRVGS